MQSFPEQRTVIEVCATDCDPHISEPCRTVIAFMFPCHIRYPEPYGQSVHGRDMLYTYMVQIMVMI